MPRRAVQGVIFCALTAQFLLLLVPWAPFTTRLGNLGDISVDLAFAFAAPHFFLTNVQYGPEAIFTYGPLMFLAADPIGKEFLGNWVVAFKFILATMTVVAIVTMIVRCCDSVAKQICVVAASALICTFWFLGLTDSLWIAALVILVVLRTPRDGDQTWLLLAIFVALFAGVASLVKFTILIVAGWSFLVLAISDLSRRKWPIPSMVFALGFPLSWTILAGQQIENLPTWVSLSLNLSSGYSDAMAKGFYTPYAWGTVLGFYLAELALLLAICRTAPKLTTIYFTGLAFLGVKHAFGGNQIEQECVGLLFTSLCVAMLGSRIRTRRLIIFRNAMLVTAVICAGAILFNSDYVIGALHKSGRLVTTRIATVVAGFGTTNSESGWEIYKTDVRTAANLPSDLKGTTDIYPSKTVVPLSHPALTYQARPAFLSLNAHTLRLAKLNRDFLASSRAPDNILFEILADGYNVNRRLPATEDGMSWPDIFARYALSGDKDDLLILKRRAQPAEVRFTQLFTGHYSLGETIDVPEQPLIWAQIDVRRSLAGKLVDLFYKSPLIFIDEKTDGGPVLSHQLVPELGRAGFLLSPYVGTTANFRHTMMGNPEPRLTVKSFVIRQENGPVWLYNRDIDVTLSELDFSGDREKYRPSDVSDPTRSPDEVGRHAKNCAFAPELFYLAEAGEDVVQMHAPCQSLITIPPGFKTAVVHFGLRDSSYLTAGGHTGGATFQISSQTGAGSQFKLLWSTELNTFTTPADRKMHTVSVPVDDASVLKLETDIGSDGSPAFDHTYWGRVEFLK
jgi:hypothetical protein